MLGNILHQLAIKLHEINKLILILGHSQTTYRKPKDEAERT